VTHAARRKDAEQLRREIAFLRVGEQWGGGGGGGGRERGGGGL